MCRLQGHAIEEEKIRQDLVSSNGFCNFHFHEMARLTSPLVNAVLTKDLIDKEVKEIEGGFHPPPGKIECPVCRFIGEKGDFYLREFITVLREKSKQKEYEQTDGLCRIHTIKVFYLLDENELSQFLRHTQLSHLKKLSTESSFYIQRRTNFARNRQGEKFLVGGHKKVGREKRFAGIPLNDG